MQNTRVVCRKLNQEISRQGLAIYTWGNVSVKNENSIFIKPSGVPFDELKDDDISEVRLQDSEHLSGKKPSVDTPIHLEIYRNFANINAVIHTHSHYATAFAQAKTQIPILGTTHADYFPNDIPVAEQITLNEQERMETLVGRSIVELLKKNIKSDAVLPVLIPSHGVVLAMQDETNIIEYAVVLEEVAKLAAHTLMIKPDVSLLKKDLDIFEYHFNRKHGVNRYYGQTVR